MRGWLSLWRRLSQVGLSQRQVKGTRDRRAKLTLDLLEDRTVPSTVTVSIAKVSDGSEEGPANGQFTISRDSTDGDLTVNYSVGGTASAGDDYEGLSGTVTIPDGEGSVDLCVNVVDDADVEDPTETVDVQLTSASPSDNSSCCCADPTSFVLSPDSASLTIEDNENHPPSFDEDSTFSVDEDLPAGTVVGTVTATDPDDGQTISYSISGGPFAIDSSGQITTTEPLDYESMSSYDLTVTATDNGSPAQNGTGTVHVNVGDVNEAPAFDETAFTFTIDENSSNGTSVGTASATDPDSGQTLTYSLSGSSAFAIDPGTGEITVADVTKLDHETSPSFTLTVTVTDSADPSLSATATVTVNLNDVNEAPKFGSDAYSFTLAEDVQVGDVIGSVSASDVDANQTLTYSLLDDYGGALAIDSSTGVITLASLDFDMENDFTVPVLVTDSGNPFLTAQADVTGNPRTIRMTIGVAPLDYQNGAYIVINIDTRRPNIACQLRLDGPGGTVVNPLSAGNANAPPATMTSATGRLTVYVRAGSLGVGLHTLTVGRPGANGLLNTAPLPANSVLFRVLP